MWDKTTIVHLVFGFEDSQRQKYLIGYCCFILPPLVLAMMQNGTSKPSYELQKSVLIQRLVSKYICGQCDKYCRLCYLWCSKEMLKSEGYPRLLLYTASPIPASACYHRHNWLCIWDAAWSRCIYNYSLPNVILVDEKWISFYQYLWYSHKCGTIVISIPGAIL